MPVASLKGDEPGAPNSSDWLTAGCTPLRKQLTKAISTIGFVISGSKSLSSQGLLAVSTGEALPVPGVVSVCDSSLSDHLTALDAFCSELLLITLGAVNIMLLWYEALGSDRIFAGAAHEALFMPLPGLVFHFLHSSFENIPATIASGCKLGIIARSTVDSVCLGSKLFINKAGAALITEETSLVPMLLFVGEIL